LDYQGQPLNGATVKIYQVCERDGVGKVITDQIKAQGTTDADGLFTLPNVPIDPNIIPPVPTGDTLHDNPFGYVHVVGTNGVLLFRVEHNEGIDYCWLDITECCTAYWKGQTDNAVFERQLVLGGPVMRIMPKDLAELTAYDWVAWAEGATASVEDDTVNKRAGAASVKFVTDGGFDTYLRYPQTYTGLWDLSDAAQLHIWFYAENTHGFQNESPWIRLKDANGSYFEYTYYENGNRADFLNIANYNWSEAVIALDGAFVTDGWNRTAHGTPNMSRIQMIEIHADTWDYGFSLWIDDVRFDWPEYKYRDFATDDMIDIADLQVMAERWLQSNITFVESRGADLTQDKKVDMADFAVFAACWREGT
jgi:choline dehydrogenase-like flavoprotein